MTPKAQETKGKIDTQYYIKLKSFYTSKKTINKSQKGKPGDRRKYLRTVLSDGGSITKIHKEHLQLNNKQANNVM